MNTTSTFVLRHRRWVMLAWLVVALVGVATLSSTTKRLSTEFKMPGEPSFVTDSKINALYHTEGPPTVVAVTAPAGQMASPAIADQVFRAAAASVPRSRMADQANSGDAHFTAAGGRTSFALIFTPIESGFKDTQTPVITAAAAAAAPAG
jgi:putative drug exporter of the RND superfamily